MLRHRWTPKNACEECCAPRGRRAALIQVVAAAGFSRIAMVRRGPAAEIGTAAASANLAGSGCFLLGSLARYLAQGPITVPAGNDFANPVFLAGSVLFLAGSVSSFVELAQPLRAHQSSPRTAVSVWVASGLERLSQPAAREVSGFRRAEG